jgi:hypothetical protein
MPLRYGLLRSIQSSLGLEMPLPWSAMLSIEGYFSYLDPTIFDLTFGTESDLDYKDFIDRLTTPRVGRAYGLELMIRRKSKSGLYGWISYTLSRSERDSVQQLPTPLGVITQTRSQPYDFDRTHLLNVVLAGATARLEPRAATAVSKRTPEVGVARAGTKLRAL